MSKKLLNETQVRRFMKLANINEGGYGGMGAMGARDEDEGAAPVGADPAAALPLEMPSETEWHYYSFATSYS